MSKKSSITNIDRVKVSLSFETDQKNVSLFGITLHSPNLPLDIGGEHRMSIIGDYNKLEAGPNGSYSLTMDHVNFIGPHSRTFKLTPDLFEGISVSDISMSSRKTASLIIKSMEITLFQGSTEQHISLSLPIFTAKKFEITEDDCSVPMKNISVIHDGDTIAAKIETWFDTFTKFGIPQYMGYEKVTMHAAYNVEDGGLDVSCIAHKKNSDNLFFSYTPTPAEKRVIIDAITYTIQDETGLTPAQFCQKDQKKAKKTETVTPVPPLAPAAATPTVPVEIEPEPEPAVVLDDQIEMPGWNNSEERKSQYEYMRLLCYELYKLHWMQRVSFAKQVSAVKTYFLKHTEAYRAKNSFSDFITQNGYNGELYISFEEFLDTEYRNTDYVKMMLEDEDLYNKYLIDLEILKIVPVPQEYIDVCVANGWDVDCADETTTLVYAGKIGDSHESIQEYTFCVFNKSFIEDIVSVAGSFDPESYAEDKFAELGPLPIRRRAEEETRLITEADELNKVLCTLADELEKVGEKKAG